MRLNVHCKCVSVSVSASAFVRSIHEICHLKGINVNTHWLCRYDLEMVLQIKMPCLIWVCEQICASSSLFHFALCLCMSVRLSSFLNLCAVNLNESEYARAHINKLNLYKKTLHINDIHENINIWTWHAGHIHTIIQIKLPICLILFLSSKTIFKQQKLSLPFRLSVVIIFSLAARRHINEWRKK